MPEHSPCPALNAFLAAALDYHTRGWAPIPLQPRGKRPLGSWKACQQRRLTVDQLRSAWQDCPDANVGCVMGPISGLVGIDVDGPGDEVLLLVLLQERSLPHTPEFVTGKGRRLLFALPPGPSPKSCNLPRP
jgi:hypothetical protein